MTTPTPAMLDAILKCTLLDDVFQEDTTTIDLEAYCASITGKEAGLFVLSGTMGNQLALRSLLPQPPYSVLCDHRAHIYTAEAGGIGTLSGAMITPVQPENKNFITLHDVEKSFIPDNDVHNCPTRIISLEITLNGMITPLTEVRRIAAFAQKRGVKMHCDGARLWEAVASGAGSLSDFAACFDTISMCFSKGLGAPVGSILVSTAAVVKHARWVRKSIGGGMRQIGLLTSAARVAIDQTFRTDPSGEGGLLGKSHEIAKRIAKMWADLGGKFRHPVHTNVVWLDLGAAGIVPARFNAVGKQEGLSLLGERMVVHYQIYQNRTVVLPKLERVMKQVMTERGTAVSRDVEYPQGKDSLYRSL